jgi:isoquinoline 1-oxidoreductase beta subunit
MKVSRRQLFVGAAAGTGLLIGWAAWPRRHAISWSAGEGEALLNAWVKLGVDGRVIVAVPQAEMGQGIWSGLAQILADEMGADWRTLGVEPAPLGAAYANRFALGEMTRGLGVFAGVAHWTTDRVVEFFELQMTGGSSSVRGYEAPLRAAGAVAREMLCRAAAARLSVNWRECDTDNGFVVHKANRIAFAELALEAARIDPPRQATLRSERRLSGRSVPRLDIPAKVDGTAQFGADVRVPGMVFAAIQQGPIGGTRKPIDKARLAAGCVLVEEPDFVAVAGPTWWQARTALDALGVEWETGENAAGAWMEAVLDEALDKPGGSDGDRPVKRVRDDEGARGLLDAGGAGVLEADYALPFLAHACLETMTATVRIENGRAECWTPTQSLTITTWAVARALGMDDEAVTVYPTLLGGGFGRKIETDAAAQAARIAKAIGKPVQLVWSREEDFAHDCWRPAATARLRARLDGEGPAARIAALAARLAVDDVGAGAVGRNLPKLGGTPRAGAQALEGMTRLPYLLPAVALEHVLVDLPVPVGFWRSVGHSYTAFVVESFIDELAAEAQVNPGGFRLVHLNESPRHAAVLRALVAATPAGMVVNGDGSRSGTGLALWESFGSIVAMSAEVVVRAGEPPQVIRLVIAADCGRVINPDSVKAQLEGAAIFGLTAALHGEVRFEDGEAVTRNFDGYPLIDMASTPEIEIILIESEEAPGGVGEVGTPPVAPAVANAIYAASGERRRRLPLGAPVGRKPVRTGASRGPAGASEDAEAAGGTTADGAAADGAAADVAGGSDRPAASLAIDRGGKLAETGAR